MSDKIPEENIKVEIPTASSDNSAPITPTVSSGGQVPQNPTPLATPTPITPTVSSGGQVPQNPTPAPITQQASFYNPEKEIDRLHGYFVAVVVFVVVSFLGTFYIISLDFLKDKDIYLKYDDVYKNYADQNSDSKIQINNLENEIELLKAKNPYLK